MDNPAPSGFVPVDINSIKMDAPKSPEPVDQSAAHQLMDIGKGLNDQNPQLTAIQLAGVGAGEIGKAAVNALPDTVKNAASSVGNAFKSGAQNVADYIDSPATENAAQTAGNAVSSAKDAIPGVVSRTGSALMNLAPVEGIANGVTAGAKAALESSPSDLLRTASSVPGDVTPPKPPSIRPLADITAANQGLAKNTNALYKKADDLNFSLTPDGGQALTDHVTNATEDATGGLDKQNHPGVIAALKTLQSKADSDDGLTLMGADKVRQTLGRIAQNANPDKANEVYAANKARAAMDEFLGMAQNDPTLATGSPDAIDALNAARKAHGLEMQHSDLRTIIRNANGNGNKIQSAFQKLYNNEDDFNSLIPENQPIIQSVAQPGRAMNAAQAVGNMGFGAGGNKYALGSEALAALVNPASASVIAPTVAVGTASNVIRNRMIQKAADTALKNLEAASEPIYPLYGEPKISYPPTQKALPAPQSFPALPAPDRPYVNDPASGELRPMDDDELALHNMSPSDQAKRMQKVPQSIQPDELQQIKNAQDSVKSWNSQYQSLLSEGKTHLEAVRQLGNPPTAPKMPQDWGTGYGDNIRRMQSMSEWDKNAKSLQDAGNTPKEVLNKLGKRPEPPTFKKGGRVEPTEAQKKAGNYQKEHISFQGLPISIENPKGSIRSGKDKNGKDWSVKMSCPYGYFKRSEGKDGDNVDCFIGPNAKSLRVYIIDQKNDAGAFDEHKVMLGFKDREAAISAYRASYSDKKNRIMHVSKMLMPEFKDWLKLGNTKKPIKSAA